MSSENVSTDRDDVKRMLYPRLVAVNGSLLLPLNPVDSPAATRPVDLAQPQDRATSLILRIIFDGLALAGTSMYPELSALYADDAEQQTVGAEQADLARPCWLKRIWSAL
ncbi:hypothetical protein FHT86_002861 [Rhizobium sp. BK313]|uniref:hypothetical protein n=1 Tax=Rhizobium sp. BK313 TaxID=2587081 RepID=UPI00105EC59A|nr:hypothetical protein [Rhizobium sp. BK313]MBB3454562.1 hypothetical protein [Rhizobium sp. BK313]